MLETLRTAVAAHGVREVHSKLVVLGERGESPPGFTAVTLLDESHVTAREFAAAVRKHAARGADLACTADRNHALRFLSLSLSPATQLADTRARLASSFLILRCRTDCYSDRGWLAVDVFTCGGHDPRPLAASIRQQVEERAPGVRCLMHENVPRFHYDGEPAVADAALTVDVAAVAASAAAVVAASSSAAAADSAAIAAVAPTTTAAPTATVAPTAAPPATTSSTLPRSPGPASTIRLLRQRRRSAAGVMRAGAPSVRMLAASDPGEPTPEDSAPPTPEGSAESASASETDSALLASFASRLEEEGGAAKLQMQSESERASRAVKASSSAAVKGLTSLVDLDSEKAKAARPQGGDGLLDVQSWRLTVGFFVLTIGLACFSAATTDFGDGSTELGGSGTVEVNRNVDNAGVDYLLGRR